MINRLAAPHRCATIWFVSDDDDDNPLDVEKVFAAFKRGVREHVRGDNVTTHFDLGIAYAEMGMLPDAANEFELVLRTDPTHTRARAELALLHARMGNPTGRHPLAMLDVSLYD